MWIVSPIDANMTVCPMVLQGFDWSQDHSSLPERETYKLFPSTTFPAKLPEIELCYLSQWDKRQESTLIQSNRKHIKFKDKMRKRQNKTKREYFVAKANLILLSAIGWPLLSSTRDPLSYPLLRDLRARASPGGLLLNNVLYGKAPPWGSTTYLFMYHFWQNKFFFRTRSINR